MHFYVVLQSGLIAELPATSTPARSKYARFARDWTLQPESSMLGFQSVRHDTKVGTNPCATDTGRLSDQGTAKMRVTHDASAVQRAAPTDGLGGNAANQTRPERRAASVVGYRTAKGAAFTRPTANGYRAASRLVANASAENRLRNRRIEFKVVE